MATLTHTRQMCVGCLACLGSVRVEIQVQMVKTQDPRVFMVESKVPPSERVWVGLFMESHRGPFLAVEAD